MHTRPDPSLDSRRRHSPEVGAEFLVGVVEFASGRRRVPPEVGICISHIRSWNSCGQTSQDRQWGIYRAVQLFEALILPFLRMLPSDSSWDQEAAPGAFEPPSRMACMVGVKSDDSGGAVVASLRMSLMGRSSASFDVRCKRGRHVYVDGGYDFTLGR